MDHHYMPNLREKSVWLIAQSHSIREQLAYTAMEAGRFTMDNDAGKINCGRDDYMLLYTIAADGEILYDGEWTPLPPQSLLLIDCRKSYELRCACHADEPWVFFWLRINGKVCDSIYETVNADGFAAYVTETPDRIEAEFGRIMELFHEPGIESSFRISHGVSLLLTMLVDMRFAKSPKRSRHQETIAQATRYIQENYNTALDIDQLARQAQLSKYYFIKLFKEFMNIAPYEYVIVYRINEAKKYLRSTTMKVSQISEAVGFNDECNFIRTFKRVTGSTPLQYRDSQK